MYAYNNDIFLLKNNNITQNTLVVVNTSDATAQFRGSMLQAREATSTFSSNAQLLGEFMTIGNTQQLLCSGNPVSKTKLYLNSYVMYKNQLKTA